MMNDSYSTSVKGAQDYCTKAIEFARTNTETAFEFAKKLTSVKSPSEFFELSTAHSRKQFETLTEQAKELTLAQKTTLATTEPLKAGAAKAFSQLWSCFLLSLRASKPERSSGFFFLAASLFCFLIHCRLSTESGPWP